MPIPLSNEVKALVDGPNSAHLATLMPDGSPQCAPVWVDREGDRILICTGEGSLKAKNTRRDPRVALSIVDFHDPYEEAQLRGRVVERQWVRNVQKNSRIKLSVGGEKFEAEARFLADPAERDWALAAVGRKYWVYSPVFAVGKLLTVIGLMRNQTGAFEVTLIA